MKGEMRSPFAFTLFRASFSGKSHKIYLLVSDKRYDHNKKPTNRQAGRLTGYWVRKSDTLFGPRLSVQACVKAGRLTVVRQALVSAQVRVCWFIVHSDQSPQTQFSVH